MRGVADDHHGEFSNQELETIVRFVNEAAKRQSAATERLTAKR